MPGLNKTFHYLFVEFFCLTFNIPIDAEQFDEILSNSCHYERSHELCFEFDFLTDEIFSELSSNLLNFCNTEVRDIVNAIYIDYDEQEISLDISRHEPHLLLVRKLEQFWSNKMSNL